MMNLGRQSQHDERLVDAAVRELAGIPVTTTPLPDPSFLWWKAQWLRRFDAEREATAPIEIGERVQIGAAILGAVALLAGVWDRLPAFSFGPLPVVTIVIAGAVLVSAFAVAALQAIGER